ncbi:Prophage antirepressor [Hyella patelloides LEGE 07179]|uniref:Prophage antirepressor n=1 Tax=Hyella patelloides LEGE 07179 TaxID=945734 RepID=A0A563W2G2_9CYAN|nr:BRO family protein [Hyella patelloides]VEP17882.1 Prophage antirepressor [Hyella patelloides LEGE 07179]
MSNLSIFEFESQQVRFVGTAEKPEWVAVDLCKILGIKNVSDTLAKFDEEEKGVVTIDTLGGEQSLLTLTEPGLYRLIFKSRKDVAKRFQRWIFHEVLPSIRKTGSYSLAEKSPSIPALPTAREELETIRLGMDLFVELGGCDDRTKILLKDQVRNILLAEKLQPSLTSSKPEPNQRLEYPVSDRAIALGYRPNNKQLQQIGKQASLLYFDKHGRKPVQREQFVGGTTRMVNVYSEDDVDLLDFAILRVMGDS